MTTGLKALTFFLVLVSHAFAQQNNVPLNHSVINTYDRLLNYSESGFHTSVKPYNYSEVKEYTTIETIYNIEALDSNGLTFAPFERDLIDFSNQKIHLGVSPLIESSTGYDFSNKDFNYEFGLGIRLMANFGPKVNLSFAYKHYWGNPVSHIYNYINHREVVPGYRKAEFNDGEEIITSKMITASFTYTPIKHFSLEVGHGKHFWGDGYRSFFLSYNAPNYPYVKLTGNFWRIKYTYLFNVMKYTPYDFNSRSFNTDISNTKYGVFHYVSIDVAKWLQLGFFEGVIWERSDSTGTRGIEIGYLNPVILLRPIEFGLGSPDNVILGLNMKFKAKDRNQFYTQFTLDDLDIDKIRSGRSSDRYNFYRTKFAVQLGHRVLDAFGVKNLSFQTEYNLVRPYTFAHKTPEQNYAHLNQSLTHPLGANFWELLSIIKYRYDRFFFDYKFQLVRRGADDPTSFTTRHEGGDIFVSDFEIAGGIKSALDFAYGNPFLQGVKTKLLSSNLRIGYLINPTLNMTAEINYNFRKQSSSLVDEKMHYIGFTVKTGIFDRYTDF